MRGMRPEEDAIDAVTPMCLTRLPARLEGRLRVTLGDGNVVRTCAEARDKWIGGGSPRGQCVRCPRSNTEDVWTQDESALWWNC